MYTHIAMDMNTMSKRETRVGIRRSDTKYALVVAIFLLLFALAPAPSPLAVPVATATVTVAAAVAFERRKVAYIGSYPPIPNRKRLLSKAKASPKNVAKSAEKSTATATGTPFLPRIPGVDAECNKVQGTKKGPPSHPSDSPHSTATATATPAPALIEAEEALVIVEATPATDMEDNVRDVLALSLIGQQAFEIAIGDSLSELEEFQLDAQKQASPALQTQTNADTDTNAATTPRDSSTRTRKTNEKVLRISIVSFADHASDIRSHRHIEPTGNSNNQGETVQRPTALASISTLNLNSNQKQTMAMASLKELSRFESSKAKALQLMASVDPLYLEEMESLVEQQDSSMRDVAISASLTAMVLEEVETNDNLPTDDDPEEVNYVSKFNVVDALRVSVVSFVDHINDDVAVERRIVQKLRAERRRALEQEDSRIQNAFVSVTASPSSSSSSPFSMESKNRHRMTMDVMKDRGRPPIVTPAHLVATDDSIPKISAVFCGYIWTDDEYHRLKSAHLLNDNARFNQRFPAP